MEQKTCNINTDTEDWILAKEGIDLLINNKAWEAEELFKTHTDNIQMAAGYAFVTFMNALMSYEEDKLTLALNTLKNTERRCANDMGWLKSVKSRMFGTDNSQNLADSLEKQIILADTQVCVAILTFLQQEFSGYIKGGWVLRKAWKIYQHVYNQILDLYKKTFSDSDDAGPYQPNAPTNHVSSTSGSLNSSTDGLSASSSCEWSIPNTPSNENQSVDQNVSELYKNTSSSDNNINDYNRSNGYIHHFDIPIAKSNSKLHMSHSASRPTLSLSTLTHSISYPLGFITSMLHSTTSTSQKNENTLERDDSISPKQIARLMSAASFGYGVFQLSVSLLPPTMLKLTQLFGFSANRKVGLNCLMYARKGNDMRAPLATLGLLWYHTIVRPFFALDGCHVTAGTEAAVQLMNESQEQYGQSALFLFFHGRINRLMSRIPAALNCYQQAVENASQREVKLLCLHEVGWCYLIQLDYTEARNTFILLKQRSRWSRSFYTYLAVICAGASQALCDITLIQDIINMLDVSTQKGTQLEIYLSRRLKHFPQHNDEIQQYDSIYWKLFIYELLYLWNALPSCHLVYIEKIIEDCKNTNREPMIGLSKLVAGSCYYILGDYTSSIESFRSCLTQRAQVAAVEDVHISAFAQYELAMMLIKNVESHEEGKILLQKVQTQYRDYDFDHRLNIRVHAMLKTYI